MLDALFIRTRDLFDWYSEDAMDRLRRLLIVLRRQKNMSLDGLAATLGMSGHAPSASTLSRFLNEKSPLDRADLSVRHLRGIRAALKEILASTGKDEQIAEFERICFEDLAHFSLFENGVKESTHQLDVAAAQSADDRTLRAALCGNYLIVRAFENGNFILSVAVFSETEPTENLVECRIYRITRSGDRVWMDCETNIINRLVYIRGMHPLNKTIRFMCYAPTGVKSLNFTGFLSGFETPGMSFSAKTVMVRIAETADLESVLTELKEVNDGQNTVQAISKLAVDSGGALALIEAISHDAYCRIAPDYI